MADILTLAEARRALGWPPGRYSERDPDLADVYIPMVTEAIESPKVCGRMADRVEHWQTMAASPLTTPWASGQVIRVEVAGRTISGWSWAAPILTVTDPDYIAGAELTAWVSGLPVPRMVHLAARVALKHVWNLFNQGAGDTRPHAGGEASADPDILLPPLAWKLLSPYRALGAFA